MSRSVVAAQTAGRVADIRVAAASVVDVDDGLRVDVRKIMGGSLLEELESAYTRMGSQGKAVSVRQKGKQQTFQAEGPLTA